VGHVASCCFKRFNRNFLGAGNDGRYMEKQVAAFSVTTHHGSTSSFPVDPSWYADTGATDHITGELEKLTTRDKYHGHDQVHTANGSGMNIDHIGSASIHTSTRELHLKNVLHVPQATKSLIVVSKLASDNDAFVEYHPHFFIISKVDAIAASTPFLVGRQFGSKLLVPSSHLRQGGMIAWGIPPESSSNKF
jgi:hypothetical protein